MISSLRDCSGASSLEGLSRDQLIEEVKYGRMSPAEAEAEASKLGFGPLAATPDPRQFNPMDEVGWTLPMTVAWIAWRDPQKLLQFYDPYLAQCFDWHFRKWRIGFSGPIYEGHFLNERPSATLSHVSLLEHINIVAEPKGDRVPKVREAKATLWEAMQDSRLEATGLPSLDLPRGAIPAREWHDLEAIEERGRDTLRRGLTSLTGYTKIVIARRSVLALWPEVRKVEPVLELPPTIRPEGAGDFPLYCAVQWIATQGGTRTFDPAQKSIWDAAYDELKAHIRSGLVSVTGVRNGIPEKIDGHIFSSSLRVDHSFAEVSFGLIVSDDLYLSSYAYLDPESWHNGFDDSLRKGNSVAWSKLTVLKSEVANCWPFEKQNHNEGPIIRTGAAGRPTPIHLVMAEHRSRLVSGSAEDSVTAESERLAEWLKESHPNLPQLTAKTIRNNIAAEHRAARLRPK